MSKTKLIQKARRIAIDGINKSDNVEEAQGSLLFLLFEYGENEVVKTFLDKYDTSEPLTDIAITIPHIRE